MISSKIILFPLLRDITTIPPTISILNYFAKKGFKVVHFTYFTDVKFGDNNIEVIKISKTRYPGSLPARIKAKTYFYNEFYKYLFKNRENIEVIWMGAWDILGIEIFKKNIKLVYHYHELETHKFKFCRKSDFVIMPEENRAWITFFEAKLKKHPLLLPNIPNYSGYQMTLDPDIIRLQESGKIVVLYSGLIDNQKRNLKELVYAFIMLPNEYHLVIMPSFVKIRNDFEDLIETIKINELNAKVSILNSKNPPKHLDSMATADIGVGFYSPISLNNVYAAPNRLYEFVNFGTPVVLPNFPSFKALSKEFPYAVNVADPKSPASIAQNIKCIIENRKTMKSSIEAFKEKEGNYDYYANQVIEEIFRE